MSGLEEKVGSSSSMILISVDDYRSDRFRRGAIATPPPFAAQTAEATEAKGVAV